MVVVVRRVVMVLVVVGRGGGGCSSATVLDPATVQCSGVRQVPFDAKSGHYEGEGVCLAGIVVIFGFCSFVGSLCDHATKKQLEAF